MDNTIVPNQKNDAKALKDPTGILYKKALEEKIESLKELCDTLDPYLPICLETKEELLALGVKDLDNPFSITNQLLLLMEDSIIELQKL